jgi:uncharacterized protein (TIGR02186 family)
MKPRVLHGLLALLLLLAATGAAQAERLITSLSSSRVLIGSQYSGAELVLFGSIEREGLAVSRVGPYHLIIIVRGPPTPVTVREKERIGPVWVNATQRKFVDVPGFLAVLKSGPLAGIIDGGLAARRQLTLQSIIAQTPVTEAYDPETDEYRAALVRLRLANGLFQQIEGAVTMLTPSLFRVAISLPGTAPTGNYEVTTHLFADGSPLARETSNFEVRRIGFEAAVHNAAQGLPFFYGLAACLIALAAGWLASVVFRRD